MTGAGANEPAVAAWSRACRAAALFAIDPGLGVNVHAAAGPVRDRWLAMLHDLTPPETPFRRAPLGIGDDRLLGGLDLPATLRAGRPVAQSGLLAESDGGVLILAMAERISKATAARILGAMDSGEVRVEREGLGFRASARFGLVALDEGCGDDEGPPAALLDRLAFHLDLDSIGQKEAMERGFSLASIAAAREKHASAGACELSNECIEALATVAARLGVASARVLSLALRAARACCALRGGEAIDAEDVATAARLVLGPRATQLPAPNEGKSSETEPSAAEAESERPETQDRPDSAPEQPPDVQNILENIVLAAAAAAIPDRLLSQIQFGRPGPARSERGGKAGACAPAAKRGQCIGSGRGQWREGRMALLDTIRAAAPWQQLRRKGAGGADPRRVIIHAEDFRFKRFRQHAETSAIFVVDASGSAAMQRLAEVKGAIELLLADCYVRRDSVALVAFRGVSAEIILQPTHSLARAKRTLAGLPGGGGTPIAAGIETALALADSVRRKGQSPLLVLMTDGRANIGRGGAPGRAVAMEDALQASRLVRAAGISALAIDTAPVYQCAAEPPTQRLGQAMNARYVKLPQANAAAVSQAVRAAAPAS